MIDNHVVDHKQAVCKHAWEVLVPDAYVAGPIEYCPKCQAVKQPWYADKDIGRFGRFYQLIDFRLWYANRCHGDMPPMLLTDTKSRDYWDERLGKNI